MESEPWLSISFGFITYVFIILLGVAVVATCFSCLAFIACCNCIGEKESHLIHTKCTSLTDINNSIIVIENPTENDLDDNPAYQTNTTVNNRTVIHPPLIENEHKVETELCIYKNITHRTCQPITECSTFTHIIKNIDSTNKNHKQCELNSRSTNSSQAISRQWNNPRGLINSDSIETDV